MIPADLMGFSVAPDGTTYLIGLGPVSWLAERNRPGCALFTRPVQQGDLDEVPRERDLSGADFKRSADRVDGYDRDDLGESPDY